MKSSKLKKNRISKIFSITSYYTRLSFPSPTTSPYARLQGLSSGAQEARAPPEYTWLPTSKPEKTSLTSGGIPDTAARAEPEHSRA